MYFNIENNIITSSNVFKRRCTSTMSAKIISLVTADSNARAARTIAPRLAREHGSAANSVDASVMASPNKIRIKIALFN
jgi:hypothetical protein